MSVLDCIVLHNMCIEKKIASTTAWISLLTKITKQKSSEDIRRNLKMVSGLNTADTSKGGAALINNTCEYLWFKKQYYEDY